MAAVCLPGDRTDSLPRSRLYCVQDYALREDPDQWRGYYLPSQADTSSKPLCMLLWLVFQ